VIYDKTAKAPVWEKYVYETMLYKKERVDFLKRVLGYAITGKTSEQVMFFFVGHGKNGKTKMVTILQELFGSYSRQMPAETLKATKQNTIGNDLYYIKDARAVFTTELNQDMQLDEAKIKQLTGQDKITSRPLYGEHVEYISECKIFYNTNNFPIISSKDDGMWRRVVYIPFEHYVEEQDRDYDLEEKLLQEKSGILNWILDGSKKWYEQHLNIPDEIWEYAYNIRGKNDNVYDFIKECCIKDVGCFETTERLYEKYVEWLMKAEACEEKLSLRKFSAAFNKYNYTHSRKMVNNVMYRGINGIRIK
jgi:putative DNA primase/helicase